MTAWLIGRVRYEWPSLLFLTMCSTGEQNGYNIPELSPAPDVEKILSEVGAGDVKNNPNVVLGDQAKRLVSYAYMCFYQSPDVRMYR